MNPVRMTESVSQLEERERILEFRSCTLKLVDEDKYPV